MTLRIRLWSGNTSNISLFDSFHGFEFREFIQIWGRRMRHQKYLISAIFSLYIRGSTSLSLKRYSTIIISLSLSRCQYRQPWGHSLFRFLRAFVMEQDHAPCLGLGLASALVAHTLLLAIPPCGYSFFYIEYHPYWFRDIGRKSLVQLQIMSLIHGPKLVWLYYI